jgi:branched-chain amino acid transport system substrate-binding protein
MNWKFHTAALAAMLGVAGAIATPATAAEPIRFGLVVPLSGPVAVFGVPQKQAVEIMTDEVNAKGGILGRKLEIVTYDDQAQAEKTANFVTRLIENDDVSVILGPSTTGTTMAAIPIAQEAGVPLMALSGGLQITEPPKKWVFRFSLSDREACQFILDYVKAHDGTNVALISDTGAYGKSMRGNCIAEAAKRGMTIVADESYGPNDADMTAQLTKIKNTAGVQAIVNCGFAQGPAIVVRNYRSLGIAAPLYESQAVASKDFITLAGPAAEGIFLALAPENLAEILPDSDPQAGAIKAFQAALQARFHTPVSGFAGNVYDGFWMAVKAIEAAGSTDKAKVRDAIEATHNFIGMNGIFNMSPTDHNGISASSLRMVVVKNGTWAFAPK